jgi:acyl-lipid Delta6-acetylenase / acyl-lipid (9-3)-desaturase
MVRFIANLHVKKVLALTTASSRINFALTVCSQIDKTPTPDPDIRRWPFWIQPDCQALQAAPSKNVTPAAVKAEPRFISREEVSQHNSASSAYIILDNKVYDVTAFAPNHPGTEKLILLRAGTDASESFFAFHPPRVRDNYLQVLLPPPPPLPPRQSLQGTQSLTPLPALQRMYIGWCERVEPNPVDKAIRALDEEFSAAGYFTTDLWWYAKLGLVYLGILAGAVSCVLLGESFAVRSLLGGALLGLFLQQLAFVGHDCGHNAIMRKLVPEKTLGLICGGALTGISSGWWKSNHNTHHIATNMVSHDPDIHHLPMFAVTTSLLGATSTYYNKVMTFDWISKFFVRNQHLWFMPVMAIARINLYVQSLVHILVNMRGVWRYLELASMLVYFSWLSCLIAALPTYQERVVFFILSHALTGILHIQICVSHFSMETIDQQFSAKGESWTEHQCRTTLDIAHNQFSKFVHGGLDMQIEHHLFPRMARHNLYKVRRRRLFFLFTPVTLRRLSPAFELC